MKLNLPCIFKRCGGNKREGGGSCRQYVNNRTIKLDIPFMQMDGFFVVLIYVLLCRPLLFYCGLLFGCRERMSGAGSFLYLKQRITQTG